MADQVQAVTEGVQGKVQSTTSGIVSTIEGYGNKVALWGKSLLDRVFPPEQRAEFLARLQAFMLANPKLSTFLGINIALTGVPLALFIIFSLTVAIFSLVVGLIIGLLGAVLFTVTCVGIALTIVFPTVFFTTMTACFLFLWGLGGYYLIRWMNSSGSSDGDSGKPFPEVETGSIGDSLNSITGGRLTGFMESAKAEKAKGDIRGFSDEYNKPKPPPENSQPQQPNGSAGQKQNVGNVVGSATSQTSNVHKATKATGLDGVHSTGAKVTGAVKGGLGGTTGLV